MPKIIKAMADAFRGQIVHSPTLVSKDKVLNL
jgi:hypothetical protein